MFYNPSVITDENGRVDVSLQMADTITTWRLSALASSLDGRLGSRDSPMRVFQDFFEPASGQRRSSASFSEVLVMDGGGALLSKPAEGTDSARTADVLSVLHNFASDALDRSQRNGAALGRAEIGTVLAYLVEREGSASSPRSSRVVSIHRWGPG